MCENDDGPLSLWNNKKFQARTDAFVSHEARSKVVQLYNCVVLILPDDMSAAPSWKLSVRQAHGNCQHAADGYNRRGGSAAQHRTRQPISHPFVRPSVRPSHKIHGILHSQRYQQP